MNLFAVVVVVGLEGEGGKGLWFLLGCVFCVIRVVV